MTIFDTPRTNLFRFLIGILERRSHWDPLPLLEDFKDNKLDQKIAMIILYHQVYNEYWRAVVVELFIS